MTTTTGETHVVLGAGPAGKTIVDELLARGLRVRHVSRGPIEGAPVGVETVRADVSSADQAVSATAGAAAIYHAVNVPYHLQVEQLPEIGRAVLAAAGRNDARLVVLDTLYPYGEADGTAITEDTLWAATSRKGRMRAALDQSYLDAHHAGHADVVLGRAADFYGPRVLNSTLGGAFFPAVLTAEPALGFGDITLPHSYSYLPDIARGLVDLGTTTDEAATGRVWHLPTVPAVSTEHLHDLVERITGSEITARVLDRPISAGPFDERFMNEYAELFYQHLVPQNMVSAPFEQHFDRQPTPLVDGLRTTLDWYRDFLASQSAAENS
ncbi:MULTISPECIES: NAD-dependent epimerase/dehydratase family protein [unclassified Actinopolyspora]|uniref:NAD-dependent epimerase/dehydratase family protein n=1 Tax=unclassified Actinopolyspora TaxID=2639451 RepID=UPI0013F5F70F|nr:MULTISPECIES: NAD-dependent epimerase/dehydratase family protein [unclassified Actinopolyspora]NHD15502.1 NAD(P)H-binding protein [Actinopolyspora sp. BKK2]NHE75284.1 NAD(P)H-binding protein [Actinopolyspora sp. BKK1]